MRKTTQETFEKRCVEKYGDRFTFDKTIYINNRTKVILFDTYTNEYIEALPQDVYNGKIRTKNKKFTTKNFIKWSKEIFGDNFTYDKSICNNSTDKVIITCKKHGDFEKIAYSHINQKQGCPKCSDNFRTKNMIISEAVKIFGDLYDYSLVKDSSPNDKIQIICKEHGIFTKTPHEHIVLQKGCPFCAREKHKKKVNEFIVDSNLKNRHLEIINGLGGKQGFDSQHKNDIIKQQFCKDNNIQLLYFTKEKQDTFLGDKCFHNVNDIIDILKQ